MNKSIIEIRDLVKTFGTTRALDGFSMVVDAGTVAGFLGPNGAGKSTAIRVLLGMIRADSGSARVLGLDPWSDAVALHRRIAYVPGDTALWPTLTGGEIIDLLTRIRGGARPARRAELLEKFELDPTKKARTYSKGNRQKVALVSALASDAELYLLDEPTSGLDPLMEAVFTDEVRALRDRGATVLLSSHILAEVEKLCDTVTIIRSGRDVESGPLERMRHLTRLSVHAATSVPAGERIGALPGVHAPTLDDNRIAFDVEHTALDSVLRALAELGVEDLRVTPPSLEEMFLRHYSNTASGGLATADASGSARSDVSENQVGEASPR